jgi:uncharacterized membrane protein
MSMKAAITVNRPREDVERLWQSPELRPELIAGTKASVTFRAAPGDRGTEIHVDLAGAMPDGRLAHLAQELAGAARLARVKDELRRFKQRVETGEVPRSDGTPEGERLERKLKQRPAQPLSSAERERLGV